MFQFVKNFRTNPKLSLVIEGILREVYVKNVFRWTH